MNQATEAAKFSIPELKQGEVYAGAIITPGGTGHHIIILPDDHEGATWQEAMDWAKEQGGDLPDRAEQALLYRDSKAQFHDDWYWSNTQREPGSAWSQCFDVGYQYWDLTDDQLRARAVRRVAI